MQPNSQRAFDGRRRNAVPNMIEIDPAAKEAGQAVFDRKRASPSRLQQPISDSVELFQFLVFLEQKKQFAGRTLDIFGAQVGHLHLQDEGRQLFINDGATLVCLGNILCMNFDLSSTVWVAFARC